MNRESTLNHIHVRYIYILWMSVTSPNKSIMKRMVIPKAVCVQLPDYILIWRIIACAEVWRCFDFARGPRHIFGNFIIPLTRPPPPPLDPRMNLVMKIHTCKRVNPNMQSCWCVGLSMNVCNSGRVTFLKLKHLNLFKT